MVKKNRILVLLVCLGIFTVIAWQISVKDVLAFDTVIREWFYSIRTDGLTAVLKVITYMGNWQSVTALCIILLLLPKTRIHFGVPVSVGAACASFLNNKLVKHIFQRPRPDESLHLIEQGGYSFASGHSITSMVVFGLLIYLVRKYIDDKKKANILTVLLAVPLIFIGLSRIYMGVHFPTDVLAGWSLGLAILMILISIGETYSSRKKEKL